MDVVRAGIGVWGFLLDGHIDTLMTGALYHLPDVPMRIFVDRECIRLRAYAFDDIAYELHIWPGLLFLVLRRNGRY